MKLLKLIALGAVVGYGYSYLTKRKAGKSKLDTIKKNGPDWMEEGKKVANDALNAYRQKMNQTGYANKNY